MRCAQGLRARQDGFGISPKNQHSRSVWNLQLVFFLYGGQVMCPECQQILPNQFIQIYPIITEKSVSTLLFGQICKNSVTLKS